MHRKNKIDRVTKCTQFARHLEKSKSSEEVMSEGDILRICNELAGISEISTTDGWYGFYWGVRVEDPRGSYQVSFALDGFTINSTKFEVI